MRQALSCLFDTSSKIENYIGKNISPFFFDDKSHTQFLVKRHKSLVLLSAIGIRLYTNEPRSLSFFDFKDRVLAVQLEVGKKCRFMVFSVDSEKPLMFLLSKDYCQCQACRNFS